MATARSPSPNPTRAKTPDSSRRGTKPSLSIDPHLRNSCSKENEKRPTVHSSGKASKNFMAPTISAASKVAAPTPRKKILRERNEVSESLETASLASPKIFVGIEPNASSSYKIKSRSSVASPPPPADADADPDPSSVPPYDPKTNYLSPRPQFLHYRPNPRINSYVSTEGGFLEVGNDGKRLEASFSSESDDDVGTKCSTPYVPSEVEEEETGEALDETLVVEPEPETKPSKPLLPRRSKLVPFLLLVSVACVFMPLSDSPVISSSVPNDQSLARLYSPPSEMYGGLRLGEYRAIASVKVHDLASRFKRWSSDSLSYFSSAASRAGEVGFVGLVNTTSPAEDDATCSDFIYKHDIVRSEPGTEHEFELFEVVSEENEAEGKEVDVFEDIIEIDDTEREAEGEAIEVEVSGAVNEVAEFETELVQEEAIETESEALDEEAEFQTEEAENSAMETEPVLEEVLSEAIETESEALDEDAEFQTDVLEENSAMENVEYEAEAEDTAAESRADKFETEVPEKGAATNIDEPTAENHQDSSHTQPATSSRVMVGLSAAFLLLVLLVAVAAFLCIKQKRTPIATKEMHTGKKAVVGPVSDGLRTYAPTKGEGSPLQHLRGSEDLTGDFGYSVASSGLDNNTFSDGQNDDNLSHERRPRRDSTGSSSTSYGSFTTYEKLSARKGYKDEESVVVTPVRRSSRLRSHVATSS